MNIGVDLGATNIRVGLEDGGKIIHQEKKLLLEKDSLKSTINQVKSVIDKVITPEVKGIGIGVPSVVDIEKGIVYDVVNIPSWKKVPLKDILEEAYDLPVSINNDVNCFVLGEHRYGKAKGCSSVVGMAIGTGLGAGVIIENKLYAGRNCGAGEIGMVPYLDSYMECYTSSIFFENNYKTTAKEAHHKAKMGELQALKQWNEFGHHFGNAVQTILYMYDPEMIVLGGSLSKAFPFFETAMYDNLRSFAYQSSLLNVEISLSNLDNIALLGAAALIPSLSEVQSE